MSLSKSESLELVRAKKLDGEIRQIVQAIERSWVTLGRMCSTFREKKYHKAMGFSCFNDWLMEAIGRRKSTVYLAMSVAEELKELPEDDLRQMTLDNALTLSRVPKSKRESLVESAKSQKAREFRHTANGTAPNATDEQGDVHFELWIPETLRAVIDQAIEIGKILECTDSRIVAMERVVSEFVVNHPEPEAEVAILQAESANAPESEKLQ